MVKGRFLKTSIPLFSSLYVGWMEIWWCVGVGWIFGFYTYFHCFMFMVTSLLISFNNYVDFSTPCPLLFVGGCRRIVYVEFGCLMLKLNSPDTLWMLTLYWNLKTFWTMLVYMLQHHVDLLNSISLFPSLFIWLIFKKGWCMWVSCKCWFYTHS